MSGFVRKCPGGHYDMIQSTKQDETLPLNRQGLFADVCHGHCSYLLLFEALQLVTAGLPLLGNRKEKKMPKKPKHPCHHPGCPKLTDERFCEEHKKLHNQNYEKYGRDKAVHRRYGRAWTRIRASYVKTHPFCELCYEGGKIVPVEEVHHKVPLAEGGTHDRDNLISLCRSCHAKLHAERGDRWHGRKGESYE